MSAHSLFRRIAVFALLAMGLSAGAAHAARGPATAEECARVVALAQAAERDPIGVMTSPDGRWFMQWSDQVPDYNFGPDKGAFWMDNGAAKGDLRRVLRFHHMLATAAYQVQHGMHDPQQDQAQMDAKTIAGVESLLRAYESLKDKRPENRSEAIDQAIAARDQGKLAEFVKALPSAPAH